MKKIIFILALVFTGCKEYVGEDMTISVPTSLELVSTNITESVQEFNSASAYTKGDLVMYNKGELVPSIYKFDEDEIVDYTWQKIVYEGQAVRYGGNIYIANTDVTLTYGRAISAIYDSPTWEQLMSQQTYTVGSWKFKGSVVGTYPDIGYIVRRYDLNDVQQDSATLYFVDGDNIVAQDPNISTILETDAYVYHNGYLIYLDPKEIDPSTHSSFTLWNEGIDAIEDIGFSYYSNGTPLNPFDNKNHTVVQKDTQITYIVKGLIAFDTLALGKIKADSATIVFRLPPSSPNYELWLDGNKVASGGNGIVTLETRAIDTSRDDAVVLEKWHTTEIFYSYFINPDSTVESVIMEKDSTVEITIDIAPGEIAQLGTILFGMSVNAGYSNLSMKHTYQDFSIAERDPWGNFDYVERQRINTYKGTVDVKITNYDKTIRLMTSLGKQLVIVNGSTSKTIAPNSQSVFASTRMIGRFMLFETETQVSDGDLDKYAEYEFVLEELA